MDSKDQKVGKYKDAFDSLNALKSSLSSFSLEAFPEPLVQLAESSKSKIESVLWNLGVALEKLATDEEKLANISADLLAKIEKSTLFKGFSTDKLQEFALLALKSGRGVPSRDEFALFVQQELRKLDAPELLAEAYTQEDIRAVGNSVTKSDAQAYPRGEKILLEILETPLGRDEALVKALNLALNEQDRKADYLARFFGGKG